MTLLELTVVILVLLSLIAILFIGARAWKKGADRAGCLLNIRNVQQAVRSYANMYNVAPGANLSTSTAATKPTALSGAIIGSGLFMENTPKCPGAGTYSGLDAAVVPAVGTVAMTCDVTDHVPANVQDW